MNNQDCQADRDGTHLGRWIFGFFTLSLLYVLSLGPAVKYSDPICLPPKWQRSYAPLGLAYQFPPFQALLDWYVYGVWRASRSPVVTL